MNGSLLKLKFIKLDVSVKLGVKIRANDFFLVLSH